MLNDTIYMIRPVQQMIKFQVGYTNWPAVLTAEKQKLDETW